MSVFDDPCNLLDEAAKIAARCDEFLRFARDTVDGIPARRQRALNKRNEAEARLRRARQDQVRIHTDNLGKWNEDVAKEDESNAIAEIREIDSYLQGPDFDTEFEKAFARQLASLLREDCPRGLDGIAARSDDPALRQTVAEYKGEISTSINRLLKDLKEAGPLQPSEVRQARAEAERCLRRKNPRFYSPALATLSQHRLIHARGCYQAWKATDSLKALQRAANELRLISVLGSSA